MTPREITTLLLVAGASYVGCLVILSLLGCL